MEGVDIFSYRGHFIFGSFTLVLAQWIMQGYFTLACLNLMEWPHCMFLLLGNLLPDIDHPRSALGRMNLLSFFFKHRGFTHTFLGCLIISLPFAYLGLLWMMEVFLGCCTHLVADKIYSWLPGNHRKFILKIY